MTVVGDSHYQDLTRLYLDLRVISGPVRNPEKAGAKVFVFRHGRPLRPILLA